MRSAARSLCVVALIAGALGIAEASAAQSVWSGHGGDPQHTALSGIASRSLSQIVWQTPVDLQPQYSGTSLLIHYGAPVVSGANTIIIPVKVGLTDSFRVEARKGADGVLLWQCDSDYRLPAHNWVPSYSPTLTPNGVLYFAGAGGTVLRVDSVDTPGVHTPTRLAFYGLANYNAFPSQYNNDVRICTPLTSDSQGNVFFGYRASGLNPLGLQSGIARLGADGSAAFVSASTATAGAATQVLMNCAPALSNDEQTLYVAIRQSNASSGYLVALGATSLVTTTKVLLNDPASSSTARLLNDGTASPMVAPDDKVYFGVLENPPPSHNSRGWLLQFDAALNSAGAPGDFGWDDTPSLVPASAVPSYAGASSYLLMVKYNNYAGAGTGDGVNKLAILDPNTTQIDTHTGATVMKEVLTIAGVTPDSENVATFPNAVREWCINSAVVDPASRSVLAGSEDGRLYRWSLASNSFTESLTLTPGIGEAYTPTLIGGDGKVYAINNATLFAVGGAPLSVGREASDTNAPCRLAAAWPDPFTDATSLRFSIARASRVRVEIFDDAGRQVARLLDRELGAGEHAARWDGRDSNGRPRPAGVYFARLTAGSHSSTRRVVHLR